MVADRLISDDGVRSLLHSLAVEAVVNEGRKSGLITESKSGRQAVLAERVIDCTGMDKQRFLEYVEKNPATYADWSTDLTPASAGKEDSLLTPSLGKAF